MKDLENEVPKMDCFLLPLLKWAGARSDEFHRSDAMKAMANHFRLSPAARHKLTDEDNILCYKDRTSWSLTHLGKAKLMRSVRKESGYWQITATGKKLVHTYKGKRIDRRYLEEIFPSYRRWIGEAKRKKAEKRNKQLDRE